MGIGFKHQPTIQQGSFGEPTLLVRLLGFVVTFFMVGFVSASDSAVQFYLGGFDDVPPGAAGILVADQDADGFLEPDSGSFDGLKLEEGEIVGPWDGDDRIIGVFSATDHGFGPGRTGFTGVVSEFRFDWRPRVPVGVPVKFYWFADAKPGDRLGKWMRYGSYRRDAIGMSGGTIGFFTPGFGVHEVMAAITSDAPGGGDFDGSTGVNYGLVGVGDFTGVELPERIENSGSTASDPATSEAILSDDFRGKFYGLVSDQVTGGNLGEINLVIGKAGAFSGRISVGGVGYRLKGRFDESGTYLTALESRHATEPLDMSLQLVTADGSGGFKIEGVVSGLSGFTGLIDGHRASFHAKNNPAPHAGRYTMLLPRTSGSQGGDGYALVTVAANGKVSAKFRLGDYAVASDSTYLSVDGEWPLSLVYTKRKLGRLAGKLTFRDLPESDFDGLVDWVKDAHPRERFFPDGFQVQIAAVGSAFEQIENGKLVAGFGYDWRNTAISFIGEIQPNPGTVFAQWHDDNRFSPRISDSEKLKVSANRKTGLVSGSYTRREEDSKLVIKFSGVAFQKQSVISGVANRYRSGEVSALIFAPNGD